MINIWSLLIAFVVWITLFIINYRLDNIFFDTNFSKFDYHGNSKQKLVFNTILFSDDIIMIVSALSGLVTYKYMYPTELYLNDTSRLIFYKLNFLVLFNTSIGIVISMVIRKLASYFYFKS